jgi:hypothetical protein
MVIRYLADQASADDRKISPIQVAAQILQDAVAALPESQVSLPVGVRSRTNQDSPLTVIVSFGALSERAE